jgi:hypothetical protein
VAVFVALAILVVTVVLGVALQRLFTRKAPSRHNAAVWASWGAALAIGLTLFVLLVGNVTGITNAAPTFASLRAHPDSSLKGIVAFNALPNGSAKEGKSGCVYVMAASGRGPVTKLFCRPQPQARSAALRWLPNGHLQVTNRGRTHWRLEVDVASSVVTLTRHGVDRTLLSVAVPPAYTVSSPHWSPDGTWLLVETSRSQLVVLTTGSHPTARMRHDRAEDAAVTDTPLP